MRWLCYAKNGSTEELFYDSEQGSRVYAIASPTLKLELSKAGTLEFSIFSTHPMYNSFHKLKTYVRVELDGEEVFRGRVLSIENNTDMERKVQCEGDLAYLVDSYQNPDQTTTTETASRTIATNNYSYANLIPANVRNEYTKRSVSVNTAPVYGQSSSNETVAAHFTRFINVHNSLVESEKQFVVGDITVDKASVSQSFTTNSFRDTKSAIDSDLLKYYGGYLRTRRDNGIVYIDWLKNPGDVSMQPIKMGYNLIDLTEKREGTDIFTRLVPIGDSQLNISSVNGGKNYIQNDAGYNLYGAIYKVESFSGSMTAQELKAYGQAYMDSNCKDDPLNLSIKALDMHLLDGSIESIKVGSTVTVVSEPHDLEVSLTVISIEYDIQNPENTTYEIGDPEETLSQKTKDDKTSAAAATSSASRRASAAKSEADAVSDVVTRQAQTIIDQASAMYKIEADTLQIKSRVIDVEADTVNVKTRLLDVEADLASIHAKVIDISASDSVTISADTIDVGGTIHLYKGADESFVITGNTQMLGDLTVGGWVYGNIYSGGSGEDPMVIYEGNISNAGSISAQHFYLTTYDSSSDTYGRVSLADAVASFGEPTYGTGTVTIPFTRLSGETGEITFNYATPSSLNGGWSGGTFAVWFGDDSSEVAYSTDLYNVVVSGEITQSVISQKNLYVPVTVLYDDGDPESDGSPTGFSCTLNVNASIAYANGWAAAYSKLDAPDPGTGTSFSVIVPAETEGNQNTWTFQLVKGATPGSTGYAAVQLSSDVIGRIPIGDWYDAGWAAAYAEVVPPSHPGTDTSFTVSVPSQTVGDPTTWTFQLVKGATPGSTGYASVMLNSDVIGRIPIGDWYDAGQNSVNVVKDPWSGGITTFRPSAGTGSNATVQLSKGTETWNGLVCTFPIMDGQGSTGYTVTVDATNHVVVPTVNVVKGTWSGGEITFSPSSGSGTSQSVVLATGTSSYANGKATVPILDGSTDTGLTAEIHVTRGTATPGTPTWDSTEHQYTLRASGSFTVAGTEVLQSVGTDTFAPTNAIEYGWDLAGDAVSVPTPQTVSQLFQVVVPKSAGTRQTETLLFTISADSPSADGGYAYVTHNGNTLSRVNLGNWYTAGQNSVNVLKDIWSGGRCEFYPSQGFGSSSTVELSKGTETWNGLVCTFPIMDGQGSTGYTVTVDATNHVVYPTVNVTKGTWDGGRITFSPSSGNGSSKTVELSKGTETWNGRVCSFLILDGAISTGYTCTVTAPNPSTTTMSRTITTNGTHIYTTPSGYDGISSITITVDVPTSGGGGGGDSGNILVKVPIGSTINVGAAGTQYATSGYSYEWIPVAYNGTKGFMMSKYVVGTNAQRGIGTITSGCKNGITDASILILTGTTTCTASSGSTVNLRSSPNT